MTTLKFEGPQETKGVLIQAADRFMPLPEDVILDHQICLVIENSGAQALIDGLMTYEAGCMFYKADTACFARYINNWVIQYGLELVKERLTEIINEYPDTKMEDLYEGLHCF
jgi:hypothetical protein